MTDEKKPAPALSDETRRLVRGLEAFAYACNIGEAEFVLGLREVLSKHETKLAAAAMPATSPLREVTLKESEGG